MARFNVKDIARIVKEVATTATELNDSSKQLLLHQVKRLESIPQVLATEEALIRPFPVELRKTRKGYEGKTLTYIETIYYIDRLNEVFNYNWNFEILQETITEVEVIVKGRLSVEINGRPVIKEQYGQSEITYITIYDKQTRQAIGKKPLTGDACKSAGSDCLKKCSSLLGVGGELYREKNHGTAGGNNKTYNNRMGVLAPKN